MNLGMFLRLIFVLGTKPETQQSKNTIFGPDDPILRPPVTLCRPNIPSKNWSNIIHDIHFMHLGQLSGFIWEIGNKHRTPLIRTLNIWSN